MHFRFRAEVWALKALLKLIAATLILFLSTRYPAAAEAPAYLRCEMIHDRTEAQSPARGAAVLRSASQVNPKFTFPSWISYEGDGRTEFQFAGEFPAFVGTTDRHLEITKGILDFRGLPWSLGANNVTVYPQLVSDVILRIHAASSAYELNSLRRENQPVEPAGSVLVRFSVPKRIPEIPFLDKQLNPILDTDQEPRYLGTIIDKHKSLFNVIQAYYGPVHVRLATFFRSLQKPDHAFISLDGGTTWIAAAHIQNLDSLRERFDREVYHPLFENQNFEILPRVPPPRAGYFVASRIQFLDPEIQAYFERIPDEDKLVIESWLRFGPRKQAVDSNSKTKLRRISLSTYRSLLVVPESDQPLVTSSSTNLGSLPAIVRILNHFRNPNRDRKLDSIESYRLSLIFLLNSNRSKIREILGATEIILGTVPTRELIVGLIRHLEAHNYRGGLYRQALDVLYSFNEHFERAHP